VNRTHTAGHHNRGAYVDMRNINRYGLWLLCPVKESNLMSLMSGCCTVLRLWTAHTARVRPVFWNYRRKATFQWDKLYMINESDKNIL
jgi:hypothetical protein